MCTSHHTSSPYTETKYTLQPALSNQVTPPASCQPGFHLYYPLKQGLHIHIPLKPGIHLNFNKLGTAPVYSQIRYTSNLL